MESARQGFEGGGQPTGLPWQQHYSSVGLSWGGQQTPYAAQPPTYLPPAYGNSDPLSLASAPASFSGVALAPPSSQNAYPPGNQANYGWASSNPQYPSGVHASQGGYPLARVAWDRACGRSPAAANPVCSGGSGSAGSRRAINHYFIKRSKQADGTLGHVQHPAKDQSAQKVEMSHSTQDQEQAGRGCHERPQDLIEPNAKRLKVSNNIGGSGPLLPVAESPDCKSSSLSVTVNVALQQARDLLKSKGAEKEASELARPVIWPPMIIVQNLHTGIADGRWDGLSYASLKEMLGNKWKFDALHVNTAKGGGHRGVALIKFEKSVAGYNRAKEMAAHFSEKGQSRADWDRLRPKIEVNGKEVPLQPQGDIAKEAAAWAKHTEGLVEEDGARRLFCFLAQAADLQSLFPKTKKGVTRWESLQVQELQLKLGEELEPDGVKQMVAALFDEVKACVRTSTEEWMKKKLLQGLDRLERAHQVELSKKTGRPATNGDESLAKKKEIHRLSQMIESYRTYIGGLKQTTYNQKIEVERELTQKSKEVETLTSELHALRNNVQAWTEREDASRKEADEHSGCGICFEAWSKEVRRAAFDCGHATSCIDCSRDYLQSEFARSGNARRPTFKCPLGCALKSKNLIELFL